MRLRTEYRNGKLKSPQIKKLNDIGFVWDSGNGRIGSKMSWEDRFRELLEFKSRNNHCNVPDDYKENPSLGAWVGIQRTQYKKNKLSHDRIEKLNKSGFNWDPKGSAWDKMFGALLDFKRENGHCNVPSTYKKIKSLAGWVTHQRSSLKENSLTQDRIDKLEAMGFDWSPRDKAPIKWRQRFDELAEYKKINGDCNVPQKYKENQPLGNWVGTQRSYYKRNNLEQHKIDMLNNIGFNWSPNNITE